MEQNNRPRSQATHVRRQVQYVRQAAVSQPVATQSASVQNEQPAEHTSKEYSLDLRLHWPRFRRLRALYGHIFTSQRRRAIRQVFHNIYFRIVLIAIVLSILAGQLYPLVQGKLTDHSYNLGTAESLLQKKDEFLGKKLVYSAQDGNYNYNKDYSPTGELDTLSGGGPVIKAIANADPSKGLTVTDPNNSIDFKTTPKFRMLAAKQDANRLMYPLGDGTGWMVYTMQAGGVKEDILLRHANGDTMKLEYTMDLDSQGLAARLLADGSVGIYGSSQPIMGNVTTSSDKDAALLQAARKNAKKDKLLFSLPTPVVYQTGGKVSKSAKTHYELKGETITTITTGLKNATFPLTVDPAVTVTSTSSLFRDTTPESNVDFNASTGNISRGAVTGGTLPAWTTNANSLGTSRFGQGVAVYDDFVYVAGGIPQGSGTVPSTSVEISKIDSGSPTLGTWTATTSLPVGLARFQLQAYNGYLYAIGGAQTNNLCDSVSNTIYYIRIQANGQLSSTWSTNPNTIPTAVCSLGSAVYNGKMYVAGGQTTKQFNSGVTTVGYGSFNPDGSVGTFTTSAVSLPLANTGADLRAYNGYLYMLGGNGGTSNTVYYAAIANDGSIYGTSSADWKVTTPFSGARGNIGSSFTFAYDGFMYLSGGCGNFNGSFTCASVLQDTQIAQINADGSLGTWSNDTAALLPSATVGNSIVSWRGNVYSIAGCTTSSSQVTCSAALATQQYSAIAPAGEVGPLNTTTVLPAALVGHGATVMNGYIYVAGGCITNSCQGGANNVTGNVSYATLAADGTVGAWTTDTTNKLNTTQGLAYFGFTSYNGYLYATGGFAATGGATSINSSTVYYIKPNANGSLPGAWSTSAIMSAARRGTSAVAYHGFLFVMGGCTGNTATSDVACTAWSSVVDRFTLNATTGAPGSATTVAALPVATAYMGTAFYNGYVYLTGGQRGTGTRTNVIYRAQITSSGGLASWSATSGVLVQAVELTSAYAMNGYLYVTGGYDGTTTYGTIESGKITLSTGNIASNLSDAATTFTARWGETTVFSNGYLYILGGCTAGAAPAGCTARSNLDQSVEQYYASNKNTSTWTTANNPFTSSGRVMSAVAAYKGYLYVAGGCKSSFSVAAFSGGCSGNQDQPVYYAALNPDGTVGTWATAAGYNLPDNRSGGCLAAVGGYLYYIGGQNKSNVTVSTVYYNQIGSNGLPGSWSTATKPLGDTGSGGQARVNLNCSVFNGFIYATGGLDGSAAASTTVFHTPSLANGGDITSNWTSSTAFTTARENHIALAAGGYLYILGGDDKTTALSDVQYIQLDPATGNTTGSWAYTTDLPQTISTAGAYAANGYVYVMGGRTAAASCLATTQVASINSSGTLSAWNVSANNFSSVRFGNGVAFYNGYYYSVGGHNCSATFGTDVVQMGGMRSPAMKGSFSKYADLNGDGQPEKLVIYLTNAKLNTVDIEEWSMSYVSSREAANSWGTRTNVTPLVTENAYTVKAYDGSAVDQVVSRWYSLFFTINMEQSFTFTDDSQPTVYQYGLHYAPPPSKRLLHGRDFRDQNQQGLDLKLGI